MISEIPRKTLSGRRRPANSQSSLRATISAVYVVSIFKHIMESSIKIVFLRKNLFEVKLKFVQNVPRKSVMLSI